MWNSEITEVARLWPIKIAHLTLPTQEGEGEEQWESPEREEQVMYSILCINFI